MDSLPRGVFPYFRGRSLVRSPSRWNRDDPVPWLSPCCFWAARPAPVSIAGPLPDAAQEATVLPLFHTSGLLRIDLQDCQGRL